jgi:hypothetical protein
LREISWPTGQPNHPTTNLAQFPILDAFTICDTDAPAGRFARAALIQPAHRISAIRILIESGGRPDDTLPERNPP